MGSDGTLGLRAIKAHAGGVFVQSPESANFPSMPQSAIDAGLTDVAAAASALYGIIARYLDHLPSHHDLDDSDAEARETQDIEAVAALLRAEVGHDFSQYKFSTLARRIQRRMGLHGLRTMGEYAGYMQKNPAEGELLFHELLIGVTTFFRDTAVWETLRSEVIPALLAVHQGAGVVRAWVAGCSTGEEVYSLAIAFREALDEVPRPVHLKVQIFATDLDQAAIAKARSGTYPTNIAADVSAERLSRFFDEIEGGYRVAKEIREMVIFAPHNLVMDPPFTRLDLISCRNLLIYLSTALQRKLVPLFHYSLAPGGVLVLGSAETIGSSAELFTAVSKPLRIYARCETNTGASSRALPAVFSPPVPQARVASGRPMADPESLQAAAERELLAEFTPAAVLVGAQGDILYVNGRTGPYLEPAAGKANWNIFAMARPGLEEGLRHGFWQAVRHKERVTIPNLTVGTGKSARSVHVTIQPLVKPVVLRDTALILFTPVPSTRVTRRRKTSAADGPADDQLADLQRQLAQSRVSLRGAREEMQISEEALRSTNEELQSTNEEMQSTNEELTTSKEELQSMNEELQTVNQELQAKLQELSLASNDMTNLLDSTNIATLFLDKALNIRRYTTPTASLIKLIPGDIGRPITDITTMLDFPDMAADASDVLRTLEIREQEIPALDGRWFAVRIMPYTTHDRRVEGVVLTFSDITKAKTLESALRHTQAALESRIADRTLS